MSYELKFRHHFDAAHRLDNHPGPCSRLHGHRWTVEVVIASDVLRNDMVVDFEDIRSLIDALDHTCLNDVVPFNPTAENLARHLKDTIDKETGLKSRVTLWESPNASITYK